MNRFLKLCCFAILATGFSTTYAQSIFASLTGVVSDTSDAVIPGAKITLTNSASGDVRRTVSNSDGYYTFSAVPVGTYKINVEAAGFSVFEQNNVSFTGADKRNVNVTLQVGSTGDKVEVAGSVDLIAPVDSGEKSSVLTTKQLQDFSVVGRSAAEFIKILPGFAISGTGTENRSNFTGEVIGINGNGDGGSQSALNNAYNVNGLPTNSLDITADGAHVSDPGCNCATPVNPNTDMIEEFKVLTSNFSAENAKGPAVISSIMKAGGKDFHGTAYLYARDSSMNANDWINNRLGNPKPGNKYYFPGFNIGGPVLIPGTNFNKHRDKLFFFSGFEYYYQTLDTGVITATVPTAGMRAGDFSPGEIAKMGNITASGGAPQSPSTDLFPGGIIPKSQIDKSGQALMNLYPLPNANANSNGGYNYVKQITFDQNMYQWANRVDYSISDNTKLFVRYNLQNERQLFPIGLWWRNGSQVPYPTEVVGKNQSQSLSASLTHVFSPTMTNEFVFGYTYITFPNVFNDPSKVDRTALGIPFNGVYKNNVKQIPAMTGWGGEFAAIFNPGGFEAGGSKGLFADKYLPSFSDNITKVWGTHSLKAGVFYEYVINNQPANGATNGQIVEANWAGGSTGSAYADLLTGLAGQYTEQNKNPLHNEAYTAMEGFLQDSWKVSKRLTVELGLRLSHFGPWTDREGNGFAVWNPATYNNASTVLPTDYTGLTWHKRDPNVPLSGFPGKALNVAPRFGMAYDLFGSGNTVLRGGWGLFYYHNSQFTNGLDAPAGVQVKNFSNLTSFGDIATTNPGVGAIGTDAVNGKDNATPKSYSYSFTISQRIPFSSRLEIAYVGNQSSNGLNTGGVGTNVNAVPYGALLKYNGDPSSAPYDSFRPLANYQDLHVVNHNLYQNYNAMQIVWLRTKGRYNIQANYTYGKTLGINGGDEFNLYNTYGALNSDRRQIFNAAYSVELGSPVKGNKIAEGLVNGWQLSGITQVQSGANLTANTGGNFNLNVNGVKLANGNGISARSINGTDSVALRPILTCDPRSNLGPNQFVNGNCFALPTTPGVNGPMVLPEVVGPAFFNSDLGMYKNFKMGEGVRKLQFRFNAYNFLNHPLSTFRGGSSNLNLIFDPATGKISNPNFGTVTERQGHRIVQAAVKFYF